MVLFSIPVACSSKYGWLVKLPMVVLTLVPDPLVPVPLSRVTLPAVANSQIPAARAVTLAWLTTTVSLAPVVSPVSNSENQVLTVTPSAPDPAL